MQFTSPLPEDMAGLCAFLGTAREVERMVDGCSVSPVGVRSSIWKPRSSRRWDLWTHAFCTRRGGVSTGPFASLNAGFRAGDREEDVRRNLAIVGEAFAIPQGRLVLMGQVHGERIRVIDSDEPPPHAFPSATA